MKAKHTILPGILLIGIALMSACAQKPPPEGSLSVSELLNDPVYDTKSRHLWTGKPVRKDQVSLI